MSNLPPFLLTQNTPKGTAYADTLRYNCFGSKPTKDKQLSFVTPFTLNATIGNDLVVQSLRDEYSSNQNGFNVNAGIGIGSGTANKNRTPSIDAKGVSSINAGASINNGTTLNKQTVLTSLTANRVNIDVGNNTHLKGSLIASGNFDENNNFVDNKNLTLTTNTLTYENLSNTNYSNSKSLGGSVNTNLNSKDKNNPNSKVSSISYNASNSLGVSASKNLATLGNGNITIKDIENSDDTQRLNQDTQNITKELYSTNTGTKVDATLDTRLLSEEGQKQIKDDIITASAITNAIEQIASSDRADITDFFSETKKNVDVYEGMKQAIANNPTLANQLTNPNLSPEQKQQMLQNVANAVKISLGYEVNQDDVKLISTNETGKNNTQIQGHYNDGTTYINDKNNDNTDQLVNTTGHETQHAMDAKDNLKADENYATNFGEDVSFYTSQALDQVTGQSFADTNNHVGTVTSKPSIFNDALLNANTQAYSSIDKSQGEDRQLANEEKAFINSSINDFKSQNKDKYLNGTQKEYSDDKAQRLLTAAAKILVDSESKEDYDANSNYVNQNEFSQKEIDNAINYLQTNSQGETFQIQSPDLETPQQLFTSTQEQKDDSNYNPNAHQNGLTDTSLETIPLIKAGVTTIKAGVEVAPSVVSGGKSVVNSLNQIDDDIGRYIDFSKNYLQVSDKFTKHESQIINFPSKTYNNLINEFGPNVLNDAKNSSLPPATAGGVIYNIYDNWDTIKEKTNSIFNNSNENKNDVKSE